MNFGSKFVYMYSGTSDEESLSDAESSFDAESSSDDDNTLQIPPPKNESSYCPYKAHRETIALSSKPGFSQTTIYSHSPSLGPWSSFKSKVRTLLCRKSKLPPPQLPPQQPPQPITPSLRSQVTTLIRPMSELSPLRSQVTTLIRPISELSPSQVLPPPSPSPPPPPLPPRRKTRKADSNVFTLDVGSLVIPANERKSSKYVCCKKCKAIMTASSSFQVDADGRSYLWDCEFCEEKNSDINLQDDCKPASDDVTYMLEAPPVTECTQRKDDDHNVIFVIDISGSMGTTETQHTTGGDGRTQVTFVSRLDAVKKAAESQVKNLQEESPNLHIGLVAFGSSVIVYGDGTTAKVYSDSSDYGDMHSLLSFGKGQPQLKPIKETYHSLLNQITRLDTDGKTALGPGLLIAIGMAASRKGSQVIICTDGCANVGIGTLPDLNASEEVISNSRSKYKAIGEYARDHGISVSVISLRGTDCRLVHLGLVAQLTGGVVDIVDQSNLSSQFGNALSGKTIATNVTVTFILYHQLYIRDPDLMQQSSTKVEVVGNATTETSLVIEYGVRHDVNENEKPTPIDLEDSEAKTSQDCKLDKPLQAIPFQAQITFTARDGGKYMRVISAKMEQTSKREVAEAAMNIKVVGAAASRGVSEVALAGNHVKAKQKLKAQKNLGERVKEMYTTNSIRRGSTSSDDFCGYEEEMDGLDNILEQQLYGVMAAGVTDTLRAQNMMSDDLYLCTYSYYRGTNRNQAPKTSKGLQQMPPPSHLHP